MVFSLEAALRSATRPGAAARHPHGGVRGSWREGDARGRALFLRRGARRAEVAPGAAVPCCWRSSSPGPTQQGDTCVGSAQSQQIPITAAAGPCLRLPRASHIWLRDGRKFAKSCMPHSVTWPTSHRCIFLGTEDLFPWLPFQSW